MIHASGWNMSLMQLFGKGPKWNFYCDNCGNTWSKRLPLVNHPVIRCDGCDDKVTLNLKWS